MGGCRVPGPTCRERGGGIGAETANGGTADARPIGLDASPSTASGPTLTGWPRQVGWGEFEERSRRPDGEDEDAQISSEVTQPPEVGVTRQGGQFRLVAYEVTVSVNTGESWVVTSAKTAALLAHEQGHYDITGLTARDMVAALGRLRAPSTRGLEREVQALIRSTQALADRLTALYDTQTDHSRNADQQARWEEHLRTAAQTGRRLTGGPG